MIETDVLLACMNPEDRHHDEAVKFIEAFPGTLTLSPFSLIEIDMLIRSGKLRVVDYHEFISALSDMLSLYGISIFPDEAGIHGLAQRLRDEHGLTFFDSLHASAAMRKNATLYSYDRIYQRVRGLKWRRPT